MSLRESRPTNARRSRAWSVAIGRSGLGCHCEKAEPPTLAAHARGALPLVGAAWGVTARKANHNWGVTARKANHNASNAMGVTAGKVVCVSVNYRRPNRWTDQDQIWHAYADGPGDGSYVNKFDPPPKGGSKWEFQGVKKIKSPGNVMNCPAKKNLTHPGGQFFFHNHVAATLGQ